MHGLCQTLEEGPHSWSCVHTSPSQTLLGHKENNFPYNKLLRQHHSSLVMNYYYTVCKLIFTKGLQRIVQSKIILFSEEENILHYQERLATLWIFYVQLNEKASPSTKGETSNSLICKHFLHSRAESAVSNPL